MTAYRSHGSRCRRGSADQPEPGSQDPGTLTEYLRHDLPVAIITGGVLGEFGPARVAHDEFMRELREFAPRSAEDDWAVDVAFFTGVDMGQDSPPVGVTAGPVGRTQRRFIIWHRLPQGLVDSAQVRAWFVANLVETERLVREYLPTKSAKYPAAELADQIRELRASLGRV